MTEFKTSYSRAPAVQCWIKNILEGRYSKENNAFLTIFGEIRRVRIVATILERRELINTKRDNEGKVFDEDENSNLRIEFDLDDGTGKIRGVIWDHDTEKFFDYTKGDIVDIVGLLRNYNDFTSLNIEIIKKVKDPNFILLKEAEILQKIKSGQVQEIFDKTNMDMEEDSELDVDFLFEDINDEDNGDFKEQIFILIQKTSSEGKGMSFKALKEKFEIAETELKSLIKSLEIESRIYRSEEKDGDYYHTY